MKFILVAPKDQGIRCRAGIVARRDELDQLKSEPIVWNSALFDHENSEHRACYSEGKRRLWARGGERLFCEVLSGMTKQSIFEKRNALKDFYGSDVITKHGNTYVLLLLMYFHGDSNNHLSTKVCPSSWK